MKIAVIIGSVRQGRVSDRVAKWVAAEAKTIAGTEVEIVDLAEYVLPLFDEAAPPQYNPDRQPEGVVKKWLDTLAAADAFVIVTPEYNRSYPGALKNALDYVDFQFVKKPVSIVAHGSTGGAQAVASLRITLPATKAAVLSDATFLTGQASQLIDETGELNAEAKANPYGPQAALKGTIAQLGFYGKLLTDARASE
jgi:NAD(P)H-dependent FMN reductase